jgi:hypothetical protein
LKKVSEARSVAEQFLENTRASLARLTAEHEELTAKLNSTSTDLKHRIEACEHLEAAVATADARVQEMKAEHVVAVRLTKQMNRELKTQLGVESRRVAKLERELNSLRSGTTKRPTTAKAPVANIPSSTTSNANPSAVNPTSATVSNGSVGNNDALGTVGAAFAKAFTVSSPSGPMGPPGRIVPLQAQASSTAAPPPGSDAETIRMLGTRLQSVLGESEVAREKVRMLEGIVQSLSSELSDYKRIVKSNAAGSTQQVPTSPVNNTSAGEVNALRSELDRLMNENVQLRRNLENSKQEQAAIEQESTNNVNTNLEQEQLAQETNTQENVLEAEEEEQDMDEAEEEEGQDDETEEQDE